MLAWFARRIVQSLIVVVAMTIIVFLAVNVIGDPAAILISPDANQIERERIIAQLGLDQPLWRQYFSFLAGALQGNFGNSFVYGMPALQVILERMPATIELAIGTMIVSLLFGVPLGLYTGLHPESLPAKIAMSGSIIGFSVPVFWLGLILILIFSVQFGWFPAGGRGETGQLFGIEWSFMTGNGLRHLALPVMTLAIFKISLVMRMVRAGVRDVLPQEYVKFARAKGLKRPRILYVHVLKNIMIPVVTIIGLEFGSLIAFSVVTESIFAWPGMGKLIIDSINMLDRPMIVAYLIIIVFLFVAINLIVDILYTLLDPRVRLSSF
ncbi:MAG: ABC transporter permease [Bosea sp.]|uniref:ABC transporter permease n=1 Tax=Bosea sp. (in: a-proteobacteria) TaxID=1871050 RepID=UPI001ACE4C4C|nr:ABC transporter permease [Bosea sp. (in: a-proteobacteria)]MBN9453723.1 ABC transporter permease [Bosea sp. (in: a-proteobacteria)]